MKEVIIIFGNEDKEIFINNIIKQKGESLFCRNLELLKPFHKWVLVNIPEEKISSTIDKNILISCKRLFEVPLELRIGAQIYRLERKFPLDGIFESNKKIKTVWKILAGSYGEVS